MLLYSHTITPRLHYVTDLIGKEITGQPFLLTTNAEEFRQYNGLKINYSNQRIAEGEFLLNPHSLLFEKGIRTQSIDCFHFNNYKAFFKTGHDFPFDLLAAAFYLLSRYEEYLPHEEDMYGRYAHENSLAFKENFLHLPLINIWLNDFKVALQIKFPHIRIPNSEFHFTPTYDIDIAWSYKNKGWFRNLGGLIRSMLSGQWATAAERLRVLKGKQQDPFDAYAWIDEVNKKFKLRPYYFFSVAAKTGRYDKNISPRNKQLQHLIQQHAGKYQTGLHPSWRSGNSPSLIKKEKQLLEAITGKKVTASRQHFIRFTLPQTFRHLIETGIKSDFSMGYGSINGFRASVAIPFFWYDLEKEEQTDLLLHPFCYMDANSFFEEKLTLQQSLEELRQYYSIVKSVNGHMITIWHNTFLGTDKMFAGWKRLYEEFLAEI